jgi:uncharacterized membrane protein YphA (DoxX/SURF4 family)
VRSRIVPWLGVGVRLLAAGIWLAAGASKVGELSTFHAQVAKYDVLPHAVVAPFAYALPFLELGIGAYLALGLFTRTAAAVGTALMVVFVIAQAQAWARGLVLDCGCFGSIAEQKVGFWTILRDAALGIPTLIVLIWPPRRLSIDQALLGRPDRFTVQPS